MIIFRVALASTPFVPVLNFICLLRRLEAAPRSPINMAGRDLQMGKRSLPQEQKVFDAGSIETEPARLIAEAKGWALALWKRVHEGMGDSQEHAMAKAARLADVPPNTLWRLRYRTPRTMDVSVYMKLKAAYGRHVATVEADIAENLEALRALPATPHRERLVAEMEKFLSASEGGSVGGSSGTAGAGRQHTGQA